MSQNIEDNENLDMEELTEINDKDSSKNEKNYNPNEDTVDINNPNEDQNSENGDPAQTDEVDKRSIFVKNVDYNSTKDQITEHFKTCGKINRITIIHDKFTQHPKGCCYIEFADAESAENSKSLNSSIFNGRQLEIFSKRTNQPFKSKRIMRGGIGMGMRGRGGMFPPFVRGGFYGGRRGHVMLPYYPRGRGFNPYR